MLNQLFRLEPLPVQSPKVKWHSLKLIPIVQQVTLEHFTAAISATPSILIGDQLTKVATISPSLTTANFSVSTDQLIVILSYEKNGIITATITLADNMILDAYVEVIDDDVPTGISILTDSEVINEGETAEFIIMANDVTITDRVIGITVADNSANIIDTSAANHPYEEITIQQNSQFARLQVPTVEKTASFTSVMITASLNQPPSNSYTLASSNTSASVLVKDQDAQDLSISAITSSVVRGTNARFQISSAFTINSPRLIIARISSNPANLTSGSYTQEVTMNAGSNTTEFSVAVQADPNPARNRPGTITASIPGPNNTEISAVVSTFDETIPTGISIFNIENTIIEGEPAEFFVAASTTVTNDRTIAITVSDGTSNIIDTTSDNHPYDQVIIPGNSHFVRFSVDTVVKPESFSSASITATLDSSNSGLASSNTSASITVQSKLPELTFVEESIRVTEGQTFNLTIRSTKTTATNLPINLSVSPGQISNFTFNPSSIMLNAGDTSVSITATSPVNVTSDSVYRLTFATSTLYTSPSDELVITVLDNDNPNADNPNVSITSVANSVVEGNPVQYTISLDPATVTHQFTENGVQKTEIIPNTANVSVIINEINNALGVGVRYETNLYGQWHQNF